MTKRKNGTCKNSEQPRHRICFFLASKSCFEPESLLFHLPTMGGSAYAAVVQTPPTTKLSQVESQCLCCKHKQESCQTCAAFEEQKNRRTEIAENRQAEKKQKPKLQHQAAKKRSWLDELVKNSPDKEHSKQVVVMTLESLGTNVLIFVVSVYSLFKQHEGEYTYSVAVAKGLVLASVGHIFMFVIVTQLMQLMNLAFGGRKKTELVWFGASFCIWERPFPCVCTALLSHPGLFRSRPFCFSFYQVSGGSSRAASRILAHCQCPQTAHSFCSWP